MNGISFFDIYIDNLTWEKYIITGWEYSTETGKKYSLRSLKPKPSDDYLSMDGIYDYSRFSFHSLTISESDFKIRFTCAPNENPKTGYRSVEPKGCDHSFQDYLGLSETYRYCAKCNEREG